MKLEINKTYLINQYGLEKFSHNNVTGMICTLYTQNAHVFQKYKAPIH